MPQLTGLEFGLLIFCISAASFFAGAWFMMSGVEKRIGSGAIEYKNKVYRITEITFNDKPTDQ